MSRPFVLSDTTWKTVRGVEYEVAILPWGATEAMAIEALTLRIGEFLVELAAGDVDGFSE
jgi:hypothetical protein